MQILLHRGHRKLSGQDSGNVWPRLFPFDTASIVTYFSRRINRSCQVETEENKQEELAEIEPANGNGRRKRAGLLLFLLIIVMIGLTIWWWLSGISKVSTDNAFVEAHIYSVSAKVPGRVETVAVQDNQFVHKGDLLFVIEPGDYQVKVDAASAALDVTMNETSGDYAKVELSRAELQQSRAKQLQAESDLRRGKALFARDVIPREQLERLETGAKVATAQVVEKEENLKRFEAEAGVSNAGSRDAKAAQRRAQLDEAALHLGYTTVTAPADGYVTRKSVEPGNFVQAGQPVIVLVSLDDAWVTANFKESQLASIRPGQKVEFRVDAFSSRKFTGKVESIMAGTGSAFSLLPPENATGNYVKVVQRVPVRIAIDHKSDPDHLLRAGMSVVPVVFTDRTFADIFSFSR
ncbi:MAG: HlyD family secretion protein [Geobacteraceae bacterium]|nr:HlyD family secretion protein [Geobacteraceae bacterium]